MEEKQKIIRVFIGSPGGLDDERQAAHDAVSSVNRSHSDHWGVQIRLLGWETALPGYVRPQDKINEDLDKCDYFIGVLWNKWGSKPSVDQSGATSGFEEEYRRAEQRIKSGLMKDMALYFKTVTVPSGFLPDDNLQKVLDFRQQCIDEKLHFFKDFADPPSFRDMVREKLEEIGWKQTEIFHTNGRNTTQIKAIDPRDTASALDTSEDNYLIGGAARDFINALMDRPSEHYSTSAPEIARLRLLGSAFKRSGNDEYYLGNHDANLLYMKFRHQALSEAEIRGLIDCGVVGFAHQNVPLWTWLAQSDRSTARWHRVKFLAAFGTDVEKKNAIYLLDLLNAEIPFEDTLHDEEFVLRTWLSDKADSQVFSAAIRYLSNKGTRKELEIIRKIAKIFPLYHQLKIEEAVVGILSRIDVSAALQHIVSHDVDKIDPELSNILFISNQSIPTNTLTACLAAKPDTIRRRAAEILYLRNEIPHGTAETLLTDSNHDIRLIAAKTLHKLGDPLHDEIAKKALILLKPSNSLFGITKDQTDYTYYENYLVSQLSELTYKEIWKKFEEASLFSTREMSILFLRHGAKCRKFIIRNLKNQFVDYFEERIACDSANGLMSKETVHRVRAVESQLRSQMCAAALISLSSQSKKSDLDLIRAVVDTTTPEAHDSIIKYLGRHGSWSDITRITALGEKKKTTLSLLNFSKAILPESKASALLAIGKERIADLLELDLETEIRVCLIKQIPKIMFSELRDEILIRELARPIDEYRLVFAMRCVQALHKKRICSLLQRYLEGTTEIYYNSIHWLDLGSALPSTLARQIANSALLPK